MYKVLKTFLDKEDKNHIYKAGETYPRERLEPDEKRISALSSENNDMKTKLIEKIATKKQTKKSEAK